MQRRTVLAGCGSLLAGLVAGCLGNGTGGETPVDRPTTPVLKPSFTVASRNCGQGEDRASVSFAADTVGVNGVIGGSNTCESAALDSVTMTDGTLRVAIVTVMPETGTPACGQCLTDIEYQLEVQYTGPGPDEVVVRHDGSPVTRVAGPGRD